MSPARIMIIGGPGAGKSWLALRLSLILGIPAYCVDDAVHDDEGRRRPGSEIDRIVRSWASKPQWIIEGGNSRTHSDRVYKATVIVHITPPRWLRVCRVALRDRFNVSLLYWSWRYDEIFGSKDEAALEVAGKDVVSYRIRTKNEAAEFIKAMKGAA